jgi:RimJ/RimL family protein N-acetyltransferase
LLSWVGPAEDAGMVEPIISVAPAEVLAAGPVRLVRWRDGDVAAVHEAVTGSLAHLRPWMAWANGYDRAAAAAFLAACARDWSTGAAYNYAISTHPAVDQPGGPATEQGAAAVAGACSLMREADRPEVAAIGYWLRPGYLGRGWVTAAAAALVAAALELPGVDVVEIQHDVANHRSAAVPRRLGFTQVGRAPSTQPRTPARTGITVIWQLHRALPEARP